MPDSENEVSGRRVTASDVAAAAGVSPSAVSRTFTPGASVSRKTRERVIKSAQDLGYRPNFVSRSLRMRRTNLVGVIVSDLENPWYSLSLKRLSVLLQERDLYALLIDATNLDAIARVVPMMLQFQVDGLVLGAADVPPMIAEICAGTGTPVVAFGRHGKRELGIASVACDDERAGEDVAELLHARGYRRFAYVAGEQGDLTWNDRGAGFTRRAGELGVAGMVQHTAGETSYATGLAAAEALLTLPQRPDAVFCQNDVLAMGFLDAARERFGLDVPGELAVVGFDDIPTASQHPYQLTTVRQPIDAMMATTVDLITNRISTGAPTVEARLLPSELIERTTVRPTRR